MVVAALARFADPVNRLGCLRGISTLTGLALTVEIGDWSRFTGSSIGAYVGLVPCEYSSGNSRVQGSITKAGNTHVRRLLIEAAWHHRKSYSTCRAHAAGPLGQSRPGASGSRARRQPAPQHAVGEPDRTRKEPTDRERRDRPRTRRLVLVTGDHAVSDIEYLAGQVIGRRRGE